VFEGCCLRLIERLVVKFVIETIEAIGTTETTGTIVPLRLTFSLLRRAFKGLVKGLP